MSKSLGVAVAHDEDSRVRRKVWHRVGGRVQGLLAPPRLGGLGRELISAAVDPVQGQGQVAGDAGDGLADMAGAEQRHGLAGRDRQAGSQFFTRRDALETQPHDTPTALAQRRAKGVAHFIGQFAAGQRRAGTGDGIELPDGRRPRCR